MFSQPYGELPDGRSVEVYRFGTSELEVSVITYGGRIVNLRTPDRGGRVDEVVLGYPNLRHYLADTSYLGALIGRYANRIGNARFSLGGRQYALSQNDGVHSLHGGRLGFDRRLWGAKVCGESRLQLDYHSADGEEGYPGGVDVSVTYGITGNELRIDYRALAEADTVLNLTNHTYFNLSGDPTQRVLGHELLLRAGFYTPVTPALIPTGEILSVAGTPFDFRRLTAIGERIEADDQQLRFAGGYDHNWVVDGEIGGLRPAAEVYEPGSGRRMEVLTTQPALQFYSGNQLGSSTTAARRAGPAYRCGLCLETQHFPDSPNHPYFPSSRIEGGRVYGTSTLYRFWAN